jgi:hypothetical protein
VPQVSARLAVAEAAESFVVLAETGKCGIVAHVDSRWPEKAGTVLGVTAHAVQSVPVAHAKAVRSRHIAVGRHRWCGDSEAPVRPGYGTTFHLATAGAQAMIVA